jgi:hypothetical protein
VEHDLTMAYSAAELTIEGLDAFLEGPEGLLSEQSEGLSLVIDRQRRFAAQNVRDHAGAGEALGAETSGKVRLGHTAARRRGSGLGALAPILMRAFIWAPIRREAVTVPLSEARPNCLGTVDVAHVVSPTGLASGTRRRDRAVARHQLVRILGAAARILVTWPKLQRQYRAQARRLTSVESWSDIVRDAENLRR